MKLNVFDLLKLS